MKKSIIFFVLVLSIVLGFFVGYSGHHWVHQARFPEQTIVVLPEHPHYLLEDVNEDVLYKTLRHYDFPSPAVITAQAILETGNFKSKLCLEKNNLFGLYNSNKLEYFSFDSWISCVFSYRKYILNKYDGEQDYYKFLNDIGYAEDPEYIKKVKEIEERIQNKYQTHSSRTNR